MNNTFASFICSQSEIPRHHRSREAHSRHNRRAERGRYRSVLAVGVGCAVAGGWICLATVVYVVRYLRAKKDAATRDSPDDLLWLVMEDKLSFEWFIRWNIAENQYDLMEIMYHSLVSGRFLPQKGLNFKLIVYYSALNKAFLCP